MLVEQASGALSGVRPRMRRRRCAEGSLLYTMQRSGAGHATRSAAGSLRYHPSMKAAVFG